MPRVWDRSELQPRLTDRTATAALTRFTARMLAAAAAATATTLLVASSTDVTILAPERQAAAEDAAERARNPGQPDPLPGDPPEVEEAAPPGRVLPSPTDLPGPTTLPEEPASAPEGPPAAEPSIEPSIEEPATPEPEPYLPAPPPPPAASVPSVPPERIVLTDDARGRPLFLEPALAPGSSRQRCIVVTYDGSRPAVDVALRVEASGALASWLTLSVETGAGGDRGCAGFRSAQRLGSGTLVQLAALPAGSRPGYRATSDVPVTVRLVVTMAAATPQSLAGASASAAFTWTAQ